MATNVGGTGFGKNWDDKLRLLDAIDSMRGPMRAAPAETLVVTKTSGAVESTDSLAALQEKLRVYEQTCAMLEREVQVLEQQIFASLAEASRLRRELDRSKADQADAGEYIAKDQFNRIIRESENERKLLLDALESSEAELARMVKTLDLVVKKLQVA